MRIMKKLILFTMTIFILCSLQVSAQIEENSEKTREVILIKLIFEGEKEFFDMTIPVKDKTSESDKNNNSLDFVTEVASTHCDDVSPICSYGVTGKAERINSEQADVTFKIKFSKKWKKCNTRKSFIVSRNYTTEDDLKCDFKLSAVFSEEKIETK